MKQKFQIQYLKKANNINKRHKFSSIHKYKPKYHTQI